MAGRQAKGDQTKTNNWATKTKKPTTKNYRKAVCQDQIKSDN